ncbi:hypothetical protein [Limnobacter parvus]|uniref:Uncharacterized protein n=1 Tax=Limnobacter parvus TaxID=2939690 RepID=A0ABT1XKM0_9BURK|nr:hypothetical protein [Limnobacter parvus]MCR2747831.1 hypothetical protein [Limnobacter parvus]
MKNRLFRIFSASCAVLAGLALAPTQAQAINISIGVGGEVLPGVYGSVNLDNGRYPTLVYAEPLIIKRQSRILSPVYLHVPPGHLKKWDRYCDRYGACSRPVYFVKSRDYYNFSPRYIDQRYVYRDRVTYVNRGGYDRRDVYDRRDYNRRDYDRREYRRDDRRGYDSRGYDRKDWKHDGRGHGKHGRGRDD